MSRIGRVGAKTATESVRAAVNWDADRRPCQSASQFGIAEKRGLLSLAPAKLDAEIDARQKKWNKVTEPWSGWRTEKLTDINRWLGSLTERFPGLSRAAGGLSLAIIDMQAGFGAMSSTLLGIASAMLIGKFLGIGSALGLVARGAWVALRFLAGFGVGFLSELLLSLPALGSAIASGLAAALAFLATPLGWGLILAGIGAAFAYYFWGDIKQAFSSAGEWLSGVWQGMRARILEAFGAENFTEVGAKIMHALVAGLESAAGTVMSWATGFVSRLKSLFSFSFSFSASGKSDVGGGLSDGAPTAIPQSAPGGLTPAPRLRQASVVTNHNVFHIDGADPERAARQIVAALDRYRQGGMYDGALA